MSIAKFLKYLYISVFICGLVVSIFVGVFRYLAISNSGARNNLDAINHRIKTQEKQLADGKLFLENANKKLEEIAPHRIDSKNLQKALEQIVSQNDSLSRNALGYTLFSANILGVSDGGIHSKKQCVNYSTAHIKLVPLDILSESPQEGLEVALEMLKLVLSIGLDAHGLTVEEVSSENKTPHEMSVFVSIKKKG